MDMEEFRARVAAEAGVVPVGAFGFADSPELADELLDLVRRGPKRATAGAVADVEAEQGPFPEPGQHWIVLDGAGRPACVTRTEEVRVGPLYTVDAAFAWEEGEGDRTRAWWLEAHETYLSRQGVEDLEREPVLFERFSLVWPTRDEPRWWLPGVRELRGHEPAPDGPRPDLPALAVVEQQRVRGVLRFEPHAQDLQVITVQAEDPEVEERLYEAFALRRQADRRQV